MRYTRRDFLASTASASLASLIAPGAWASGAAPADKAVQARYHRYSVTSPEGQGMLKSYARGIEAMLKLPANDPRNWFRNAFVHLMDCPHGNWWFYVWHRGYVGYFEQTIRTLSGDPQFAMPYWDWTELPRIPPAMFDGVLSPTDSAYAPYTRNLAVFTRFMRPALQRYWDSLDAGQRGQLKLRGYLTADDVWNDVTGYSATEKTGISGNAAYAITCGARYLWRENPGFDDKTRSAVSPDTIHAGLSPVEFYNADVSRSFTSSRTASHVVQPDGATKFSVLEGFPHNKVHNCIGGVGAVDPGPYGNMTNFLSPLDPIFYLHHANMDRLWDVWTQLQYQRGKPIMPVDVEQRRQFMNEPFRFFVNAQGGFVGERPASAFFSTTAFDYDYVYPGRNDLLKTAAQPAAAGAVRLVRGTRSDGAVRVAIPDEAVRAHLASAGPRQLIAEVTLERPRGLNNTREFDVLINAPAGTTSVAADSPYYAGTVSFFGPSMPGMDHSHPTTFAVPLPQKLGALQALNAAAGGARTLEIRLVASSGQAPQTFPVLDASILVAPQQP
ncbi:tyrosinase family protein [Stenotrophomonas maltophilia]|jgi:tyrosinase|uniref:tyrosinase family protein n=1 Tax=Stenotrophomonas TaxID=40323 RepID=UPI00201CC631|nr:MULTISPECIES: tyrosinase family protein [Stenotrophomonas]MBN5023623.1 tyrosinase family protein [Stenotrophomonas maltophilia]MDH1272271.1 tyrosinase family protein [Stenotrophomonas sp. GD03937]MDH1483419.1 tyrosinase family protein [Stenotrophomonas sp. GD03712]UQY96563.1 tyrosinase family protein [Stenotrophomonas maltophilia]WON66800.1 tyrosinase family protein [Stenotrophomonas maltophilia]